MNGKNPVQSSQVLRCKYFSRSRLRCLDVEPTIKKGSHIFTLCMKALPRFKEDIFWIPGNGKQVRIWHDSILGNPPLSSISILSNFKNQTDSQGLIYHWDISRWDQTLPHQWDCQALTDCPTELEGDKNMFLSNLTGLSSLARGVKDK